jgi:glycosyltransferase involved in cell wall biosynthesis
MSVRFSVIVPVHNAETTLVPALDSVARQHFESLELVVVNDGSTDRSAELIAQWAETHPWIQMKVIAQPQAGLGAARNAALRASSGELIAFLDADDEWRPDKLTIIDRHNWDVIDLAYHQVTEWGRVKTRHRRAWQVKGPEDLLVRGNPIVPSATVLRRDVLVAAGGFAENPAFHGAEDLDLWLRLLEQGRYFYYLPRPLVWYMVGGGLTSRLEEHLSHVVAVIEHHYQDNRIDEAVFRKAVGRKYLEAARAMQKEKKFKKALVYYREAEAQSLKFQLLRLAAWLRLAI